MSTLKILFLIAAGPMTVTAMVVIVILLFNGKYGDAAIIFGIMFVLGWTYNLWNSL